MNEHEVKPSGVSCRACGSLPQITKVPTSLPGITAYWAECSGCRAHGSSSINPEQALKNWDYLNTVIQPLENHKYDQGKIRMGLVPAGIIEAVGIVRDYGTQKYGDPNGWKQVEPWRYQDALMRHVVEWLRDPASVDEESGLPHLYHMACNIAFLIEFENGTISGGLMMDAKLAVEIIHELHMNMSITSPGYIDFCDAFDLAIDALKRASWIPCSERLPTKEDANGWGSVWVWSIRLKDWYPCQWSHVDPSKHSHWRTPIKPPEVSRR